MPTMAKPPTTPPTIGPTDVTVLLELSAEDAGAKLEGWTDAIVEAEVTELVAGSVSTLNRGVRHLKLVEKATGHSRVD